MKFSLYSVHDVKLGVYLAPFPARNDVEASRQIANSMADPQLAKSPMVTNPEDFSLVRIANFDDESGNVSERFEVVAPLTAFRTVSS